MKSVLKSLLKYAARLIHHIGRRGAIIGFLGWVALVSGISPLNQTPTPQGLANAQFLTAVMPLSSWGYGWIIVGTLSVVAVFWKRVEQLAVGGFVFVAGVVSLAYYAAEMWGTAVNGVEVARAHILGTLYAGFLMVMLVVSGWPEETTVVTVPVAIPPTKEEDSP